MDASATATAMPAGNGWKEWWRDGWSRFRRNRLSLLGLAIVIVVVIAGLMAPLLAPFGPFELVGTRLVPPQARHLFGTDHLGRDVFSGVLYGARTSLEVGFLSVVSLTHARRHDRRGLRIFRPPA